LPGEGVGQRAAIVTAMLARRAQRARGDRRSRTRGPGLHSTPRPGFHASLAVGLSYRRALGPCKTCAPVRHASRGRTGVKACSRAGLHS